MEKAVEYESRRRLSEWPQRLQAFIDSIKREPFDWTYHNCAHFAAGAVWAVTGENIARRYGTAITVRGLLGVIRKAGHADLPALVGAHLPAIPVSQALLADIVAIPRDDAFGCTLGVVSGEGVAVLGPRGLSYVPIFYASHAFQVG